MYRDVGGYDMSCDEFQELCRNPWDEESYYLHIDRYKKKMKKDIVFSMKAKTHTFNVLRRPLLFDGHFANSTQIVHLW